MICTSSWFASLPPDHQRIGISRGSPRGGISGFRMYRKLQPGPWFNSCKTDQEFVERYNTEVLGRLDAGQTFDEIMMIAGGKTPVLVCFESVNGPQWCHRSLTARWLSQALGIQVPEFGYPHLVQHDHPLLPPHLRTCHTAHSLPPGPPP